MRGRDDSHFGHRLGWKALIEDTYGCPGWYWLAEDGERVRGVLPLFVRTRRGRALFSAPGGLLAEDQEVARALLAPARERVAAERLDYLELRDQARAWPELETSGEHCTLVLALSRDEETQWKGFDHKLRNQIRKGQKSGFTPHWGRDGLRVFHRVLLENLRDLGTPLRGARYFERALDALPGAELLVVGRPREPAGAMFFVAHGGTAYDPWASSRRRLLSQCPNQVLYWEAIRRAIALGLTRFDMGRSQWESGTFRFKAQWGAEPRPLHYQYLRGAARELPTLEDQKRGYGLAVALWKRLPLWAAGPLGERAKRMFPEVV